MTWSHVSWICRWQYLIRYGRINIDLDNDGYNKKYNSYEIVVNSLKYNKSIINNKEIYGEIKGKSVIFRCEV